jgi:uncharacterized protein (TIGR02678 family)
LTCAEDDPELFRLIRRHEATVDRWFTQRFGYRLHVDADTARLYKGVYVPAGRPLRTGTGRELRPLEYTVLALACAATASGPAVISLRDLVGDIRAAAADAGIALPGDRAERRALVTAVQWMMAHGLAAELADHVDRYSTDEDADAILRLRPDRIALLPTSALAGVTTADELCGRAERRSATRSWLRGRLAHDPVLYRDDVTEEEWTELRRRLGDESARLWEMFGLVVEARAEGVAAVDPTGRLSDVPFPAGGTVPHAALLLIDRLRADHGDAAVVPIDAVVASMAELAIPNQRRWSGDLVADPAKLAELAVDLLCRVRLAERIDEGPAGVRLLPAAARFTVAAGPQETLW